MEKAAKLDANEMERRANYLKRQRDLLIKKKAEERKRQLDEYASRNVNMKQQFLDAKRRKDEMSSSKKSDQDDEKGPIKKELTAAQIKRRDLIKTKNERPMNDAKIGSIYDAIVTKNIG